MKFGLKILNFVVKIFGKKNAGGSFFFPHPVQFEVVKFELTVLQLKKFVLFYAYD